MASILRQIVAGPRSRHPEAGLDLCYVTDFIVVTSGPSSTYPQRAYRNPTDALVKWLDYKHGADWAIWEFRAEGTGYPDSEVYGRVRHFPWPDHHPPPFHLIPNIMASMRNWLHDPSVPKERKRVVVVHCKAGKGRSGTVASSYLISQEGWSLQDALTRFTLRRMRPGFGTGVSIPSQLRWLRYVEQWTRIGKTYVESPVEVVEVHAWGLREGVKLAVQGFQEDGRKIANMHVFKKHERIVLDGPNGKGVPDDLDNGADSPSPANSSSTLAVPQKSNTNALTRSFPSLVESLLSTQTAMHDKMASNDDGHTVIFRPKEPILVPTSDICIDLERRARAPYTWTMVTAVAHVWFNVYFEGLQAPAASPNSTLDPKQEASPTESVSSGVFEITWDAMDGLKGSSRKGTKALDKLAVVWRIPAKSEGRVVPEPGLGEPVPEPGPADWKGGDAAASEEEKRTLGLRQADPGSADISEANSIAESEGGKDAKAGKNDDYEDSLKGVKTHGVEDPPKDIT